MVQTALNPSLELIQFYTLKCAPDNKRFPKMTFEFLNKICLLKGWGSLGKSAKNRQILDENLLLAKFFYIILYHQTTINPTKIKSCTML